MKNGVSRGALLIALYPLIAADLASAQPEPAAEEPAALPPEDAEQTPAVAIAPPALPPTPASREQLSQLIGVEGGLTAQQAAERAAATSRQASVKQAEVEAADAAVDKTFYGLLPRLTLTARYTRLSPVTNPSLGGGGSLVGTTAAPGPLPAGAPLVAIDGSLFSFPVILNQYFLNAGLVVPLSDYVFRTSQAVRGAKAVRESAEIDQRAARVTDAANAKLLYYAWARSKLQAAVARQNVEQAELQLVQTEKLQQAGRVADADVLQARAFAADSRLLEQRARTLVSISEQQLRVVMHAESREQFDVGENVLAEFTQASEDASLDALYQEAVNSRLEIRALEKTEYSLREGSAAQQAGSYPRLEAFGNVTYANPNQRIFPQSEEWNATWDVGVQLIWTLNDLGTASADARQTDAQRRQVAEQKNVIKDALRTEILSAKQSLEEAVFSVATAEQGLQAAEASHAARQRLYQHGRATSLEVMQAETARFQARLNLIEAHIALRTARVQLDHAVGRDTARIK